MTPRELRSAYKRETRRMRALEDRLPSREAVARHAWLWARQERLRDRLMKRNPLVAAARKEQAASIRAGRIYKGHSDPNFRRGFLEAKARRGSVGKLAEAQRVYRKSAGSDGGEVQVSAHERNGHSVSAYTRSRPS